MARTSDGRRGARRRASLRQHKVEIPSRADIVRFLRRRGRPASVASLARGLGLAEAAAREGLERRLEAMVRDGQLVRTRRGSYGLAEKMDLVRGRVLAHPDGWGRVIGEDGGTEVYLPPRQMRSVMHGDRVVVAVSGLGPGGVPQGSVVEVLERAVRRIVGRFQQEAGVGFVVPDEARMLHEVVIPPGAEGGARPGQRVVAEITRAPTSGSLPIGRVVEILGEHVDPGTEIDTAIRIHGIPWEWPQAVAQEAARFGTRVARSALAGREDLRRLPLVTIDGVDAKDFDDAVWCERRRGGWRLVVAIADVSHYVHPGSALDGEAAERGNSVYFPGRVVPMLPEVLSNGLCSLNPGVDRLCIACEMTISRDGRITRARFHEGVMRSAARLTYDEVAAILAGDERARRQREDLVPHLEELHRLYQALAEDRRRRGALDFDSTETRIEFAEDGRIARVVPVVRTDAHRIIEECMIAANVAAARFLGRHRIPTLYRVHEPPPAQKLEDLRAFLQEFGLGLGGGDEPQARDFARLLEQVRGRPDAHLIEGVVLRSLAQAVYSPDNTGHFGLAHEAYLHFTSPIRRYPDLLVHRGIRHVLRGGKAATFPYAHEDMARYGEHCSMTERRADEATRDAVDWMKCRYMLDHVGEVFEGVITGVTNFGIFVEIDGVYAQGLVHVTSLPNDYYHFDPVRHRLLGERTRRMYRLGERVAVRVVRVDVDERKIDLEPAEGAGSRGRRRGGRRRR
ncbi:ribonuclease R [Inmirania thermothiophila]|uniref:Ribonuclease R n=1 Tax=Inmirania thermothiophila TaxID=1750597 RepID=A0A3N1XZL4_9GAMM|nr:ribonuclease R [Inmirania thermothiophila]ROR32036.1 RNAse R [Inmirania thermothiophila]